MPLNPGERLGPYEILAPIGAGGMGQVYCARDPRLNREVAIKVSAEEFSERFEREARAVAALNHPNVCTLHDVGPNYLVMELVEGLTLADRIKQGPIPLGEALGIARQIADALDAAHEKNITHRDLKPGNIKVKPDGTVKVLDFGLAKIGGTPAAKGDDSPTLSMAATQAGVILGTAGYMSPEQARGKEVDKRADIWAFGVVLYEMLTGQRLFKGEDLSETLAAVIKEQPDLSQAPARVRRLLWKCLEKDPKKRLRDIGDAWELLEESQQTTAPSGAQRVPRLGYTGWIAAGALAIVAVGVSFVHFRESSPAVQPRVRLELPLPGKATNASSFELSPDGRYLAIAVGEGSRTQLWVRQLDSPDARVLPGTDDAQYPFWSPDSSEIGFFSGGKLKKIALNGGSPQTLCDAARFFGASWNEDGVIVAAIDNDLVRVSAAGGIPVPITKSASDGYPYFLPGGKQYLFAVNSDKAETNGIYAGLLEGGAPVRLLPDISSVAYVPAPSNRQTGYLLFRRGTTLMAQPFDPVRLQTTGELFPLAEGVGASVSVAHGAFSASQNGTLVYRSGTLAGNRELALLDRTGKRLNSVGKPGLIRGAALSLDEKHVAFELADLQTGGSDLWLLDLARGATSRFTFSPPPIFTGNPVWSPDSARIAYQSRHTVLRDLYQKAANGAGKEELLTHATGYNAYPNDWSPDGKFIVYAQTSQPTKRDLWLLPTEGDHKPVPYLQTPANEDFGQFSPVGRWMAYASDESGQNQIYVQSIPASGAKWQISTAGGSEPRWRRDGKELFYIASDQKLIAVPMIVSAAGVEAGTPQALFEDAPAGAPERFTYQPTADGQRFLFLAPANTEAPAPITVLLNWQSRAKK